MKSDAKKPRIVQVRNRKNGVIYLYEDVAFWNSEKKRGEHRRKCIGHLDGEGNVVYNEFYRTRESMRKAEKASGESPAVSGTVLMGQNMIISSAVKSSGLMKPLSDALGKEDAEKVVALAGFSICEGKSLSRAGSWLGDRGYDGNAFSSQRISELLGSISDDRRNAFFSTWLKRNRNGDSILFDISSISSYAVDNPYVERGYNRDGEKLAQINIGLLSAHTTNVPLWYSELPGSMSDCAVLDHVLEQICRMDVGKMNIVGDRGFYSVDNMKRIVDRGFRFTIPVPARISWQKELIDSVRGTMRRPANIIRDPFSDGSYIYAHTSYSVEEYGRVWRHVYFDPARKEQDIANMMLRLKKCEEELVEGKRVERNSSLYEKYFPVKETPKRGLRVALNEKAVDEYIANYSGYWVIVTNAEKDASKALSHYNRRIDIEQHFDDMKNTLDCNRLKVHSERTMKGRLFVNFIAQIILNELRSRVEGIKARDRSYWDVSDMLSKVATYSRIHFIGRYRDVWTVPTKTQRKIFDLLGIEYQWKGKTVNEDSAGEKEIQELSEGKG